MNIKTVKELKEFIQDFPDDMRVSSCCSIQYLGVNILPDLDSQDDSEYLWLGYDSGNVYEN